MKKMEGPGGSMEWGSGAKTRRKPLILIAYRVCDSQQAPVCVLSPPATPPNPGLPGQCTKSSRPAGSPVLADPVEEMEGQPADRAEEELELQQVTWEGTWEVQVPSELML